MDGPKVNCAISLHLKEKILPKLIETHFMKEIKHFHGVEILTSKMTQTHLHLVHGFFICFFTFCSFGVSSSFPSSNLSRPSLQTAVFFAAGDILPLQKIR